MRYPVILADPPVPFEAWGKRPGGTDSRTAESKYSLMTWHDLNALRDPISSIAADDCCLFLWMCQPLLLETITMALAWGFEYKTKAFVWVKLNPTGRGFKTGMGYWTRANSEDVLLFTRGHPGRQSKKVAQLLMTLNESPYETPTIDSAVGRHSEKPEAIQDRIEMLFARRQRSGWTCLGNEVTGRDIRDDLARVAAPLDLTVVGDGYETTTTAPSAPRL